MAVSKIRIVLPALIFFLTLPAFSWVKGIYITQPTLERTSRVKKLIQQARSVGLNTFVVDYNRRSKRYNQNIKLIEKNGLLYVARIVMFPHGAVHSQVISKAYLAKKYALIKTAVALGAHAIQLDYIRYKKSQRSSPENAKYIYNVIKSVRDRLKGTHVQLQIDIFGVAATKPSNTIGQDPEMFAPLLNAICPMVYPSHYEPFRYHAVRPYETVYKSLTDLRENLKNFPDVKIYAYIELYNYRYPMGRDTKIKYILAQLRAVRDSHADGYYVWSARNKYSILFSILKAYPYYGTASLSLN